MYKTIIQRICKADAKSKLRSFLDRNEPQLVQFLQTLWHNQGRAITYKELRNAILSGQLDEAWLEDWRQDYSRFVQSELLPIWENAMQTGAEETVKKYSYYFNPSEEGVREWVKNHAAAFVTNSTQTQIDGLRSVIGYGVEQEMSADELSRVIRPIIGLTRQQSIANVNYYNAIYKELIKNGVPPKQAIKRALSRSITYGQKQHRYRAYNIARTELAFAYNHGALFGIKQAQKLGLMGQVMKRWVTAADERTCSICENLDNAIIGINEDFQYEDKYGNSHRINARLPEADASLVPPAHPSCRCSVAFEELEVPMTMDDLDFFTEETSSGSRFAPENLESLPQPLIIEPVIFPGTYRTESLPSDEEYDIIEEIQEVIPSGAIKQDGQLDFSDKRSVLQRLRQAEADFADLEYEKNCTVTSDGKVWIADGQAGAVDTWEIETLGSSLKGSFSYHNHPEDQTWCSFSASDVSFFLQSGASFSMASDYAYEYIMQRIEETITKPHEEVYHRFKEIENDSVKEMLFNQIIDPDTDRFHEIVKILSKELKFKYARKKKNQQKTS